MTRCNTWMALLVGALVAFAACEVSTDPVATTPPPDCTAGGDTPVCPGAQWPTWQLADFQPLSAKFQQTYGLQTFQGKAVLVALFSAS